MNFKQTVISATLAMTAVTGYAQQPYSGCWFPDELAKWSPATDADAKFNRSRIPLQSRIDSYASQGQVETATITNKMCSMTPSQGSNNFLAYQPTYWQYMEKFINWGGAGNEGIFVLPPSGTIDAAHLNGVKILGTLFFMPRTIGGRDGWIEAMLTKDANGKYPYAVKMYEVAKYFGFDGWFINKELDNGKRVDEWSDFIKCFSETAEAAGDPDMEIQWYDASGNPTIEILKSHRNTSQFLEYNSTGDKSSYASQLGCTATDILHRLYSGIECSQAGLYGFSVPSSGSIALFTPEQHTYKVLTDDKWSNPSNTVGQVAYDLQAEVFSREHNTWEGGGTFSGISSKVPAMSTITSMPFTSSFSVGLGKHRFVNGQKMGTQDWNATSVQSILPQWRSDVDGLTFAYDFDDAYNHGNSVKLSGALTAGTHTWRLFKTQIAVSDGGTLRLVYKTNGTAPKVKLSDVTLASQQTSSSNGWTVADFDLSLLNGKTISEIDVIVDAAAANSNYELKLGQLSVLPAGYHPEAIAVSDVNISGNFNENDGDIRLSWSYDYNADFDHFDIFLTDADGRRLVGQTRGEGFYVPRFSRKGSESGVTAELVGVMKDGSAHTLKSETLSFRAAQAPVITVTPEKSYAKVGDIVKLTATGTDSPTSFAWTLPSSVKLVGGQLTDATIEVEALAEGKQTLSVKAANAQGATTFNGVAFEVFSDVAYKEVHNAAVGKPVSCSRAVTGSADYLTDGDAKPSNKDYCWSDISTNPHVTVDLKTPHTIYDFAIYDNHSLVKGGEDNIANYRILLSDNGTEWREAVNATNTSTENIHTASIVPTTARYVKLQPYADERFTCRLYEFEINARDNSRISIDAPHTINMEPKATQKVTVAYAMNGEERADNFGLTLSTGSSYISCSEPQDDGQGHFTFDITAAKKIGKAELTAVLQNGEARRQTFIDVILDTDKAANSLESTVAEMRKYKEDYATGAAYDSQTTGNLTDGDTSTEGLTEEMYDEPCTSANDLWAVFTNPQRFSLGKVKVYIPSGNKGVNANDKEGYVNKAISIRTSNDGRNWTTVETFSNLKEVSSLTCYLPEAEPFTYLAVVCDVNNYFYPSLAEVEAYAQLESDGPRIMPVALSASTLDYDLIAEGTPASEHADLEFNSFYSFYTSNVNVDNAISSPDSRIVISKSGTTYELGQYDKKNAFYLNERRTDKLLSFDEPLAAEKLYLLCNSTRSREVTATIHYTDGTTSDGVTIDLPRADYGKDNKDEFAVTGLKVIDSSDNINSTNYGLNEVTLAADAEKEIEGISFYASGSVELWVYAVSALTDPNASKMKLKAETAKLAVAPGTSDNIVVRYDLNGEERADNFGLTVASSGNAVTVGTPVENAAENTFTIPVTAGSSAGSTELTLTLTNGDNEKSCKVTVSVKVPVDFDGWNKDVIAEALPAKEHANGYIDGEELAFFTTDVAADGALADASGLVTTASGQTYTLAPYDDNNCLVLEAYNTMELTANKPTACSEVKILAMASRKAYVNIAATYTDGTSTEEQEYTVTAASDDSDAAKEVNLINANSGYSWSYSEDEIDKSAMYLKELSLPLDAAKALKSISFTSNSSRATVTIVAIAKNTVPSGISTAAGSTAATPSAVYNLQGAQVGHAAPGIYIVRFSDGSARKVIKK